MAVKSHFELRLSSALSRVGFVFAIVLVASIFSCKVVRLSWAAEQLESVDSDRVEAALAIDPKNPKLHNWAGALKLYDEQPEPEAAVLEFRRSTELNSRNADYWASLGRACLATNDIKCAEHAYQRAKAAAPMKPHIIAERAAYYLAINDTSNGLPEFRRLLEVDPSSARPSLTNCLRTASSSSVWQDVVRGQNTFVVSEYLQLLNAKGLDAEVHRYWSEFVGTSPKVSLEEARPLLLALESRHNYSELISVWRDLQTMHSAGMPDELGTSLVVNGNFTSEPTNTGLDWHLRKEQYLETQVDAYQKALALDFTVPHNTDHESVYQLIPVVPGHKYELVARLRSERITSDSGPRLRITDAECTTCLDLSGDGTIGTTDWHVVSLQFVAGPTTRIVRLSVWRPRSRTYPMDISGELWINDISMHQAN